MTCMTEQEAKTKWCPFARVAEPQRFGSQSEMAPVAAVNRGSDALSNHSWQPNAMCIGSACMAWRRVYEQDKSAVAYGYETAVAEPRGYCGLAGKS